MGISNDIVVVGGGAAGLAAAIAARRRGASVTLIERRRLGGDCTWTGCVPSKALIAKAKQVHAARALGLDGDIDFAAIMQRVADTVVKVSQDESRPSLEAQGITVIEGEATFVAPKTVSVDGTKIKAEKGLVLATGSVALVPAIPGLAEAKPLTNDTVFDLRALPARLTVMGGGPIGVELGQAFARLGSMVTIVEGLSRLVPREEPEASEGLEQVLTQEGLDLVLGEFVEEVTAHRDGVRLRTGQNTVVETDAILCAVGRRPVTDGLDADRGGVELTQKGFIKTDDKLATSAPDTYAVGDVVGGLQFTHVGDEMGRLVAGNALGRVARKFDDRVIPWATYTEPEIGRVGLSEAQAYAEYGDDALVAYLPIAETDRAKTSEQTVGFVKLIAGAHPVLRGLAGGQILGATVMCPTGGDVIHEVALAMRTRMLTGRLAQLVHAYPSWSLAVREAAAMYFFDGYKGHRVRPARPSSDPTQ